MPEKKRVALVLSGGASLGSYMAGALDELLKAFASASDQYEIDIITGASAGATTAAIVAHGLLYHGGETALHDVWVDKMEMADMLAADLGPDDPPSLLSVSRIRQIAKETLAWDATKDTAARAPVCAEKLTLAMTITNSAGVPYTSRVAQPAAGRLENYVQYRHTEQETFNFDKAVEPTNPMWDRIAEVARASSAIPFVFPHVGLDRQASDPDQYILKPDFDGSAHFWYYDGEPSNNLPVDLAWHFITLQGGKLEDRAVVVINPWRCDALAIDDKPVYPSLFAQARALFGAMRDESSALQFEHEVLATPSQAQQAVAAEPGSRAARGC